MEYRDKDKVALYTLLNALMDVALATTRPSNGFWASQPATARPIRFSFEAVQLPFPLQRAMLHDLNDALVISMTWGEDDPQMACYDKLSSIDLVVYTDKVMSKIKELTKSIPKNHALSAPKDVPVDATSADKSQLDERNNTVKNVFDPLQIDKNWNVRCHGRILKMPEHYAMILRFLIRDPKFHRVKDIAKDLYPEGNRYTFKTTHINVSKYISGINKILAEQTTEVKIKLHKPSIDVTGYQLVYIPPKKRAYRKAKLVKSK